MADFRKLFIVLAVLAAVAMPVAAQTCTASPAATPFVRANGLTEKVGDILLTCTGAAAGGANVTANFQVFMSPTQITNRVSNSTNTTACPTGIKCVTDAIAIVSTFTTPGDPNTLAETGRVAGLLQSNLAAGDTPTSRNSVLFPNIVIPAGSTKTIRITNIRVVAPPVVSTGLPSLVSAFVSTNPFSVTIANPSLAVANSQIGMQFTATNVAGDKAANLSFTQCDTTQAGIVNNKTGNLTFLAKFTEGFQLAFKDVNQESGVSTDGAVVPGGAIAPPSATATSGTKLMVRFSNIPAGVHLFVTDAQIASVSSPGITATLSSPTDTTGVTIGGQGGHEVSISSNTGSATWEIASNDPTSPVAQKSIFFGIAVSFVSNTGAGSPGLTLGTPGSVAGLFAPVSTVNFAAPSSSTAPIPRFVDAPQGASVFTIVPCVTNLLFPFVTNVAGFDTGIALSNTSLDDATGSGVPFATSTQTGACTVFYFNGSTTAPAPQTTPEIKPGAVFGFSLIGGGVPGSTSSAAGFQGYVIARCSFQYAHGFAFISDRNTPSLGSQGYLALVIPDRADKTRPATNFTDVSAASGQGEQLAQ